MKDPDVDIDAEPALQFNTESAVKPGELEPLPTDEAPAEDSHEPAAHLDVAGNEIPDQSSEPDDLPEVDMDRPLAVTPCKDLCHAPTLMQLIRCQGQRDSTLQPISLPKIGPNTPYASSIKRTHHQVHRHYQCKGLTSTAVWAAAYREDPRTRHICEIANQSPTARHQLRDAKPVFHLSTVCKRCLVPRTFVTSM